MLNAPALPALRVALIGGGLGGQYGREEECAER